VVASLLVLFRPRELPEQFTLDVGEEDIQKFKISPVVDAEINDKLLNSVYSDNSSMNYTTEFNSGENVVILNPMDMR